MTAAAWIWMIVFGIAGLLFFGTAAVVIVRGFSDLRDLVRRTDQDAHPKPPT